MSQYIRTTIDFIEKNSFLAEEKIKRVPQKVIPGFDAVLNLQDNNIIHATIEKLHELARPDP